MALDSYYSDKETDLNGFKIKISTFAHNENGGLCLTVIKNNLYLYK